MHINTYIIYAENRQDNLVGISVSDFKRNLTDFPIGSEFQIPILDGEGTASPAPSSVFRLPSFQFILRKPAMASLKFSLEKVAERIKMEIRAADVMTALVARKPAALHKAVKIFLLKSVVRESRMRRSVVELL